MTKNGLICQINEFPQNIWKFLICVVQMMTSVFVATVLIAQICGTPVSGCLFGACVGTLIYQIITKFQSPMFISSCGATVSAVCGALALGESKNYLMVLIGGATIAAIYSIFALIIKLWGEKIIDKILPPEIVGSITIVIGLNLAKFLVSYCKQDNLVEHPLNGAFSILCVVCAIITVITTALIAHYGKGFIRNIPFLFGLAAGYIFALIITLTTDIKLIDFSIFKNMHIIALPDLAINHMAADQWSWSNFGSTLLMFVPVAVAAICEHYSDHKTLSNIVGTDLTKNPGIHRTLIGDGIASMAGTLTAGLPNTSYGESIGTIGFSRVASVWVSTGAAVLLGIMSFIEPFCLFIQTIPSFVFGGVAMILYGYIASSGLRTLINNRIDLNNQKSLILVSVVLTVGVGGIAFFNAAFAGVSLAMILGIVLNIILKDKQEEKNNPEVKLVIHAFWSELDFSAIRCSNCGCKPELKYTSHYTPEDKIGMTYTRFTEQPAYCPDCGAKMDAPKADTFSETDSSAISGGASESSSISGSATDN